MPSSLEVVVRATPVCVLVSVTLAPAITAPVGSVTVPLTVPRLVWANADAWNMSAHARSVAKVSSLMWVLTVYLLHLRATGCGSNKLGIGWPRGAIYGGLRISVRGNRSVPTAV